MMRRLLCSVIFLFCLSFLQLVAEFDTITQLVFYSKQLPEFPEDEYIDPYKPRYQKLHRQLDPSSIDGILSTFGLKPSILYDDIKSRLRRMISTRELHGYYGDFVQKFYVDVETKWYIWGALHGAFHSLVRSLNELKNQGVINNNLRIVKSRFYFVFNGNTLNYSPYQLETLYVLLRLMEANPEQVFILKGEFEAADNWKKSNLGQELKTRLIDTEGDIPLEREIDQLFNTLPLAIYLVSTDLDVARLSFYEKHPLLKEELWGSFLNKKKSDSKKIKNILPSKEKVNIKAHISSHNVQQFPYKIDSIAYKRDGDIQSWSLFSSPIRLFKEMFSFEKDTAVVLTTGKFFSNWHIELYQQSIRNPKGFLRSREFNIASGKEVFTANQVEHIEDLKQKIELAQLEQKRLKEACGDRKKDVRDISQRDDAAFLVNQKEEAEGEVPVPGKMTLQDDLLVIGTMQDLSKTVKIIGIPFKKGLILPIEDINNQGGINGLKIRLVALDDEYNPEITRRLVQKFLNEYKTDVLLGAQGTPTLGSYLDLIREKKVLSVFPYAGSYGELALPYLLKLRASYIDIGYALTKYMIDKKNIRRFALFYQDDHFGGSNLKGAKEALKEAGIEELLEVPYEAHEADLSQQAAKILAYNPDAIGLFSVPFPSERLLNEFAISAVIDKAIFANEFHGSQQFRELVEQKGLDLTVAHVMPNPHLSSLPIVQEYRDRAKRAGMAIDEGGLEGYVTAALFIDILKRLQLPFTKDKFVQLVENIKNYDFKGLQLNFDPKTRQLFKTIWIDTGGKKWIEQVPKDVLQAS